MYIILSVAILLIFLFLIWASADISSRVYIKSLCKKETSELQISLTFDDGPDPKHTPLVLEVLRRYNVKATFFLIGKEAEKYPDLVKQIVDEGHTIGSHTYSHACWNTIKSVKAYIEELLLTSELLRSITGFRVRMFRPPFGVTNPLIARSVNYMNYHVIGWSIRSYDTVSWRHPEKIIKKILPRVSGGDIILLHDRCINSEVLTDRLINALQYRGFSFTTVDKLFLIEAYE